MQVWNSSKPEAEKTNVRSSGSLEMFLKPIHVFAGACVPRPQEYHVTPFQQARRTSSFGVFALPVLTLCTRLRKLAFS